MSSPSPASPPCGQPPLQAPASPPSQSPGDGNKARVVTKQKLIVCDDHPCADHSQEGDAAEQSQSDESESSSGSSEQTSDLEPPYDSQDSSIVMMCGVEGFWVGQVSSLGELNRLVLRGGKVLPSDDETISALVALRSVMGTKRAGPYAAAIGNFDPRTEDVIVSSGRRHSSSFVLPSSDDEHEDDSASCELSSEPDSSAESSSHFDDTNLLGEDSDEENSDEDSDAEDIDEDSQAPVIPAHDDDSDCRVIGEPAKRPSPTKPAPRKKRVISDSDDE